METAGTKVVASQILLKPADDAACLCGSGRPFGECCGGAAARGATPDEIVVADGFVPADVCKRIVAYADTSVTRPLRQDAGGSGQDGEQKKVYSPQRIGELIPIDGMAEELVNLVGRAWRHQAEPGFRMELEWFECPQLLRYGPGGRYVPHADSERWDAGTGRWQRAVDRDYSLLIYLDQTFTGGSLSFPNFDFVLKPTAGMLVIFPSDARYLHEATPVESGRRHVLVSWAARLGSNRVRAEAPRSAFFMPKRGG